MSIVEQKNKQTYSYYYPEQIELFEGLELGDISFIARKVGKTSQYINLMSKGKRKITPAVEKLVKKISALRKEITESEI